MAALGTIIMFLGGLGLFMYGVGTTSNGLQKFAAVRLRQILHSLTKRTFLAVIFGMVMTVAFQSSAATTVLVVEFVNAELMNLAQALGIVLGSAVGTSLTIQLIAFKIQDIALGAIFLGFILYLLKKSRWRHLGQALIGFGIIFVGMANMADASAPLKSIPQVYNFLAGLGSHPFEAILVGVVLTAVIQSTPAVFAVMMSLAGQHLLQMEAIVPLVLGAHIGGTITTLLSSFTTPTMDAKRTALANTGYKVVAMLLVLPFLPEYARLVQWTTADLPRQVANAHLLFAVFMVVIFFPFNKLIAKLLVRWLPDRDKAASQLSLKYIDEASSVVPEVAIKQAGKEINTLGEFILKRMVDPLEAVLVARDSGLAEEFVRAEKAVDWYYRRISEFLTNLSNKGLTDEQAHDSLKAQFVLKELEYVGDVFIVMVQQVQKLHQDQIYLSTMEWSRLEELYRMVKVNYTALLQALTNWDKNLAARIVEEHANIRQSQRALEFCLMGPSQIRQTDEDLRRDKRLKFAMVDLSNLFTDIDQHTRNIAQVVTGTI